MQPVFPHPSLADHEGLLAVGGDLSLARLKLAYRFGIYPWYAEGYEILWWSPDPRCVLYPGALRLSKSMRTLLRRDAFTVTADRAFAAVIRHCKTTYRPGQSGTWITDEMEWAYQRLHAEGICHSVEVWSPAGDLVGGLYGVGLGELFFGESMFSLMPNASKFGFIRLVRKLSERGYRLIDCQQDTPHLRSLGATTIPRDVFLQMLRANCRLPDRADSWFDWTFE